MFEETQQPPRNPLIRLLNGIVSTGIYTMTGILILQVFSRYVLDASLSWSEELSRYLMIWTAMLGAVAVLDEADYVSFRWFVNMMGPRLKRLANILVILSSLAFLLIMVWYGTKLGIRNFKQLSPALYLPIGWVYLALPVGSALISLRLIIRLFEAPVDRDIGMSI